MNIKKETSGDSASALETVRADIDRVDLQVIELFGKRAELVRCLAELKKGGPIRDPDREREVLEKVKGLALKKGLRPDVVENVYRILFRYFVELQQEKREQT